MLFAEFYTVSTGYVPGSIPPRFVGPKTIIPALGSDSVAILDGRWSVERAASEARRICRQRKFSGFALQRGEAFSRARNVRPLETV